MNRVYDRVHLLFPKPSQPAPIEGLSPEVTLKLLQYLDFVCTTYEELKKFRFFYLPFFQPSDHYSLLYSPLFSS